MMMMMMRKRRRRKRRMIYAHIFYTTLKHVTRS